MRRPLTDAERQFLLRAARDIQQRLAGILQVRALGVEETDDGSVTIVVEARGGSRRFEFRGHGPGLVEAYQNLFDPSRWDARPADDAEPAGPGGPPTADAGDATPGDARKRRPPPVEPAIGIPYG